MIHVKVHDTEYIIRNNFFKNKLISASKYSIESSFVSFFGYSLFPTPIHPQTTDTWCICTMKNYLYSSSKNMHPLSDKFGYKQQNNFDFYAFIKQWSHSWLVRI